MNGLRGKIYEYKKYILLAVFLFFIVIAVFYAGYLRGVRNICNNGAGTGDVGNQFVEAGTNISNAKNGIETSKEQADSIANSIGYISDTVEESGNLIADCQRIIKKIRGRGKIKAVKN